MNSYEKHIGDYIRDTVSLTMLEDGAYNRLLDQVYQHEKPLPLDKKVLYRLARAASTAERKAVDFVLSTFFTETAEGYEQKRVRSEIERYQEKQRKAKASADARWNRKKSNANASELHLASDTRKHSKCDAHQAPDTHHQSPDLHPPANANATESGYGPRDTEASVSRRDDPRPGDNHPAIALTVDLRKWGVNATFTNPNVQDWAADPKTTRDVLAAAVAEARETMGTEWISPQYLAPIVERLLNSQVKASTLSLARSPRTASAAGARHCRRRGRGGHAQ
jgi:uncharacterized protein YdaU (DUF1376 family)